MRNLKIKLDFFKSGRTFFEHFLPHQTQMLLCISFYVYDRLDDVLGKWQIGVNSLRGWSWIRL